MSKKKFVIILLCTLLAGVLLGVGVYAAISYGTQEDPLITKSYVDTVLVPQLEQQFRDELEAAMPDSPENSGDFTVLTLSTGDSVICGVGCELILRVGSAMATGSSSPAMVDTTSGSSFNAGTYLMANHLCVVTIEGNGFIATSDVTKVLIKGEYSLG